ncbi:hypothetical protein [Thermoactinomyces sp. DSM 45891]|uniref:hypothetical protein n=1 Tax=Thermoactinomyces sp. DSM 45891 TaxID=1761907 RepID=UPI000931C4AC|nr:hypothetical protein [Thermoactinomyces sp. DSM 45891]
MSKKNRAIFQISSIFLLIPTIMITGNTLLKDYPPHDRPDWVWILFILLLAITSLVCLDTYLVARRDPVAKKMSSTTFSLLMSFGFAVATFVMLYQWQVVYSSGNY